jgi:hypothetical protein
VWRFRLTLIVAVSSPLFAAGWLVLNAWQLALEGALHQCMSDVPAGVSVTATSETLGWRCVYEYPNGDRVEGPMVWLWS